MKKEYADEGIYCHNNPWGFVYNVNHPFINEKYRMYKNYYNLPENYPISDNERRKFELMIWRRIESGAIVVKKR